MNIKSFISDKSNIILLISNIIIIILAVVQKWNLLTLIWTYLMQSIIIGFFNLVKILTLKDFSTGDEKIKPSYWIKVISAFFFVFQYGIIHLLYIDFFRGFEILSYVAPANWNYILSGSALFFLNHLFSFFYNKRRDLKKKPDISRVMFFPYARIIPMELMVLIGGVFIVSREFYSIIGLVFFLSLKTVADLVMHWYEHKP